MSWLACSLRAPGKNLADCEVPFKVSDTYLEVNRVIEDEEPYEFVDLQQNATRKDFEYAVREME